ncbi:ATP-binding protein [Streptomyces sp. NPDC008313]|uniref:ATP-binding protein n=1 Tax=Streptomyces sp. NPDC008313 TaxID=3364826 RepID=UPI0036EFAA7E
MSIWWSLHLRREAASVPLARRLLLGTMETAGVDPDVSYDLSVALSEACANAVEHGGCTARGDSAEAYRVTAYLDGEKCRIEVADSGPGFPSGRVRSALHLSDGKGNGSGTGEPLNGGDSDSGIRGHGADTEAEHGRGLWLIQELADHVHIGDKPGRGGTVVSFDKILKWRDNAPLALT